MNNSQTYINLNNLILFVEVSKRTIVVKVDDFTWKDVVLNSSSIDITLNHASLWEWESRFECVWDYGARLNSLKRWKDEIKPFFFFNKVVWATIIYSTWHVIYIILWIEEEFSNSLCISFYWCIIAKELFFNACKRITKEIMNSIIQDSNRL